MENYSILPRSRTMYSIPEGFAKNETTPLRFRERIKSQVAKMAPSRKIDLRKPIATWNGGEINVTSKPNKFAKTMFERVQDIRKSKPQKRPVIVWGGVRGAGKTSSLEQFKEMMAREGLNVETVSMDAYFKEPDICKAPGGWDNPKNSDLKKLARSIKQFQKGKAADFHFDRVPRHGDIKTKRIDPKGTHVLLVEGIHALEPSISRRADVRGFFYIPPGLQEVRTWIRDLKGEKALKMPPEYYTGLNTRVRPWHSALILPRIKDAEVVFEQKYGRSDLEAITRLIEPDEEKRRKIFDLFAKAWDIK